MEMLKAQAGLDIVHVPFKGDAPLFNSLIAGDGNPIPPPHGYAALTGAYPTCESEVVVVLMDLLHKRRAYAEHDGERFMDAIQNARLIANAEQYYRIMYYGSRASWNLRDAICSKLSNIARLLWSKIQSDCLGSQFSCRRCVCD